MSANRVNGLLMGASLVAILAGCSSPRDPFANRLDRPDEQCLAGNYQQGVSPQAAFGDRQVMRYVVKKGDTLWDISKRFLVMPWYWKQLWYDNPQIRNPHLIYPGDVLAVVSINGERRITMIEGNGPYHGKDTGRMVRVKSPEHIDMHRMKHPEQSHNLKIYKYTPNGDREYALNDGPISIAHGAIKPMLLKTEILLPDQIQSLPKIFGDAGDYLTLSQQQEIYTHSVPNGVSELNVYRVGYLLHDYGGGKAVTQADANGRNSAAILGYQMDYIGKVEVSGFDVASGLTKLRPVEVAQAMKEGDVLMPVNAYDDRDFFPQLPSAQCNRGYMITNTNTQTLSVKEFDTVVTSFGRDNGAQTGDIWKIVRPGPSRVIDGKPVQIPAKDLGYLMIIRVYDTHSLGFVLDSTQNIDITDWLVRP